ncbi:MAG: hypothetical protein ACKOXB_10145 [Flavobacteriales bacterium]
MLISYLEDIKDSGKLTKVTEEQISALLNAINDWPNSLIHMEDFENDVSNFVGVEINRENLKYFISKIDYSKNAWEAESLSQLIDIFQYYPDGKTLKEILKDIQVQIECMSSN